VSDFYLFRNALKDLLLAKKLLTGGLIIILPSLIAIIGQHFLQAGRFTPEIAYNRLAEVLIFGITLILVAVVFFTGILSQEIEQKTIVYLLTRPIPRWRILLMKFLAAFLVTTVILWLSLLLLALVTYGPAHLAKPG